MLAMVPAERYVMKFEKNAVIVENHLKEKGLVFEKETKGDNVTFGVNVQGIFGAEGARVSIEVGNNFVLSCTTFSSVDENCLVETEKYLMGLNAIEKRLIELKQSVPSLCFTVDRNSAKILCRLGYPASVLQTDASKECVRQLVYRACSSYYTHRKAIAAVRTGAAAAEEAAKMEMEFFTALYNSLNVGESADGKD